jgi:hypothetical protein
MEHGIMHCLMVLAAFEVVLQKPDSQAAPSQMVNLDALHEACGHGEDQATREGISRRKSVR